MKTNRPHIAKTNPKVTELPKQLPAPQPEILHDDEISLIELINILRKHMTVILGSTAAMLLMATIYSFTLDDIYRAEMTIAPALVNNDKSDSLLRQLGDLPNITNISSTAPDHTTMAMAILKSRAFTDEFIRDEKILPLLVEVDAKASNKISESAIRWQAFSRFDSSMRKIDVNRSNGIVTLAIEWTDPEQAALWANRLIDRLNQHMQNMAIAEAENSISYLNDQLNKTSVIELQSVIYRLIEGQIKKITLANVNDQYAFKIIDPAMPPQQKIRPRRQMMIILSAISGLMLGVFLAFLINFIKKIKNSAEIR